MIVLLNKPDTLCSKFDGTCMTFLLKKLASIIADVLIPINKSDFLLFLYKVFYPKFIMEITNII